jgi:hypothetical protein
MKGLLNGFGETVFVYDQMNALGESDQIYHRDGTKAYGYFATQEDAKQYSTVYLLNYSTFLPQVQKENK